MNWRAAGIAIAVGYPALVVAGISAGSETLTLAGLAALVLAVLLPGLLRGRVSSWLGAILAIVGLLVVARADAALPALIITPILIPGAVAWTFGRTLLPGRTPLIGQLVRLLHGPNDRVDPEVFLYARRLTWLWCLLTAGIALTNATLGALMSPGGIVEQIGIEPPVQVSRDSWAWFANVFGYLIVGIVFVAEYAYRRHRFPDQPYRSFADFLRRSIAAAPRLSGAPVDGGADVRPLEDRS